jgi:single-strand DNA-binding protein
MRSVNKVILFGNLTRDPELKQTEGKKPVCLFGLATNRSWMSYTGEKHEETEFHRIIAWDQWAETCQKYLKKSRKVYVEGRLQSHTYTGQDGVEKTGVEVVLEDLVFVDSMPKDVQETLEGLVCFTEPHNGPPHPPWHTKNQAFDVFKARAMACILSNLCY